MNDREFRTVAVIGAGIAGAACARALTQAGHDVHVFDKSGGPGGRLATRRFRWTDAHGNVRMTALDHGAVGFSARSAEFRQFVGEASSRGWLAGWRPVVASGSRPLGHGGSLHVPVPDLPALARRLLEGVATTWSFPVDTLHRASGGWAVESAGGRHDALFDAVVIAIPPAQAAVLLNPHRPDWAHKAQGVSMQPCWTLMGVEDRTAGGPRPAWDAARPPTGPLAWIVHNDARPGRERGADESGWVAHATTDWTSRHLEDPAADVESRLKAALCDWLGRNVVWHHATVHRWRYALPPTVAVSPSVIHWWDASCGMGVCGDFFATPDAEGVEGAWRSAQSMTNAILG